MADEYLYQDNAANTFTFQKDRKGAKQNSKTQVKSPLLIEKNHPTKSRNTPKSSDRVELASNNDGKVKQASTRKHREKRSAKKNVRELSLSPIASTDKLQAPPTDNMNANMFDFQGSTSLFESSNPQGHLK